MTGGGAAASIRAAGGARRRSLRVRPIHAVPAIVLILLLAATGAGTAVAHRIVHDQDNRLLKERANEVNLVFNTSVGAIPTTLGSLGHVAIDGGTALFTKEAAEDVAAGPGQLTFALMKPAGAGYQVVATAGAGLSVGQDVTGAAATTMAAAQKSSQFVATPVLGRGSDRQVGFALAGPQVPSGMVVYRQSVLGPVQSPREAGTQPFNELKVVLYASNRPDPLQVLVTTTQPLPLHGSVVYLPLVVGGTDWLLAVSALHPLVGSLAGSAPWWALAIGVLGSILIFLVLEQTLRRRDLALSLFQSELHVAETLQRKLLPTLTPVPGFDVATRYVAASHGQQVGGDWFDAFDLGEGRAGVVIGDVVGHDMEAAAAMAQVRSALRAYAWEGDEPALVVDRLARMIEAFKVTGLVSVIFGVIGPSDGAGDRIFEWANAGHLPPVLMTPDGQVRHLADGRSAVLGAPGRPARSQGQQLLPVGSTLVLYTDGLVEQPGVPINGPLEELASRLRDLDGEGSAEEVCDAVLGDHDIGEIRDDIAIIAVRVTPGRL